jgi:hypothetical protein
MRIVERVAVCALAVERLLWQLWLLVRQACSGCGRQIEKVWAGFHVYIICACCLNHLQHFDAV